MNRANADAWPRLVDVQGRGRIKPHQIPHGHGQIESEEHEHDARERHLPVQHDARDRPALGHQHGQQDGADADENLDHLGGVREERDADAVDLERHEVQPEQRIGGEEECDDEGQQLDDRVEGLGLAHGSSRGGLGRGCRRAQDGHGAVNEREPLLLDRELAAIPLREVEVVPGREVVLVVALLRDLRERRPVGVSSGHAARERHVPEARADVLVDGEVELEGQVEVARGRDVQHALGVARRDLALAVAGRVRHDEVPEERLVVVDGHLEVLGIALDLADDALLRAQRQ